MLTNILADKSVSVTDLKRAYQAVLSAADNQPVAVLNHNKPEAYLVPAACFEALMAQLEDMQDASIIHERQHGPFTEVTPEDL